MVRGPGALELETNDCICDDMESHLLILFWGFPGGSAGKESTCNVGDLGWEDPLEKGMATHSRVLAWISHGQRSLGGGAQSMGSQRVGHD